MVYLGSKKKYVKDIAPIINNYIKENQIEIFIDCFCGGANLADSINCNTVICNDLSPTLIALHQQMQSDSSVIPKHGDREWWDIANAEYRRLLSNFSKDLEIWKQESFIPLWKIGAIEWYSSYSRGGFQKGYAKSTATRDYYNEAYRNHLKQSQTDNYKKIQFVQGDYRQLEIPINSLIYCDSPYKSTQGYMIEKDFNFNEYYNWLREKSKFNPIFISEQSMPDDFKIAWEKTDVKRTLALHEHTKACEKLFFIDNRK